MQVIVLSATLYTSLSTQLRQYFEEEGEYGLNVDLFVALWLDSREFQNKPPLRKACGFVIVNSELQDEFDEFKKQESLPNCLDIEFIQLLQFWAKSEDPQPSPPTINKYGKTYARLHHTQMDDLLTWVQETRTKFSHVGRELFKPDCEKIANQGSQESPSIQGSHQQPAPAGPEEVLPTPWFPPSVQRKRDQAQKESLEQRDESNAKRAHIEGQDVGQAQAEGGQDNAQAQQMSCQCRNRCNARKACSCRKRNRFCSITCHPGHTCANCQTVDASVRIDLTRAPENSKCLPPESNKWIQVEGMQLTKEHKVTLNTPKAWLDDGIIAATQNLLKKQYPLIGGLQAPALAQKLAMVPQPGEFVQVLHTHGCHWITVSTIGCPPASINVYDSSHGKLSSFTKKVVADLMMTKVTAISVHYIDVQRQSGGSDCALFALAFAADLCAGKDPAGRGYDQKKMRNHLHTCLVTGKVTPFPQMYISTRRHQHKKACVELIPVFCICRLPDDGSTMIQCTQCHEWYHQACVNVAAKFFDNGHLSWYCFKCKQ